MTGTATTATGGLGVDTHAHTFTQQLAFVAEGEGYVPDHDATLDFYVGKLRAHGMSRGVSIQPSFLGRDNTHLLDSVAAHRDHLRAIVIVDPQIGQDELESLAARGVVGVRPILYGQDKEDYGSATWSAFAGRLAAVGLLVEVFGPASGRPAACAPFLAAGCRRRPVPTSTSTAARPASWRRSGRCSPDSPPQWPRRWSAAARIIPKADFRPAGWPTSDVAEIDAPVCPAPLPALPRSDRESPAQQLRRGGGRLSHPSRHADRHPRPPHARTVALEPVRSGNRRRSKVVHGLSDGDPSASLLEMG